MCKVFILIFLFLGLFWVPVNLKKETFLKHFDRPDRFYERVKKGPSGWMADQLNEDFLPFSDRKVSLEVIDRTFSQIPTEKKGGGLGVVRYRILNNKLFRFSENPTDFLFDPISSAQTANDSLFEKAVKTLTQLLPLPDLDFIVTYADGTKEPYMPQGEVQAPILGWAKLKTLSEVVLIPDWRSFSTWWYDDIRKIRESKTVEQKMTAWEEKIEKAFWRGDLTERVHRVSICRMSKENPDWIDSGLFFQNREKFPAEFWEFEKGRATYAKHLEYKYLPVLDGVMCTYPGYQWRLLSNSLCLKQESDQIQWFYRALQPFIHYVPIKNDLSDLLERIAWAKGEDETCRAIVGNSTQFVLENLMFEDIYYYLYAVLERYSKSQGFGKFDLWKSTMHDPRWVCIQYRTPKEFSKNSWKDLKLYLTLRMKWILNHF